MRLPFSEYSANDNTEKLRRYVAWPVTQTLRSLHAKERSTVGIHSSQLTCEQYSKLSPHILTIRTFNVATCEVSRAGTHIWAIDLSLLLDLTASLEQPTSPSV